LYIDDPMVVVTLSDYEYIGGLEDLNGRNVALPKSYYTTELIGNDYPEINISHPFHITTKTDPES